ncbi:MAG: hypothetical protein IH942_03890 [Acidobacteria bacterium]|nr:hypothetical protein [Acidobacteriota bacterium]
MVRVEALRAKQGDCLLLLYGDPSQPRVSLIDGGPRGVWRDALQPRLAQLRTERAPERLAIDLMMVSHIDDDHIDGLIQLTGLLKEQRDSDDSFLDVDVLWHNSFDDLFGETDATVAAAGGPGKEPGFSDGGSFAATSVNQGQTLRDNAAALALNVNGPFDGLVRAGVDQSVVKLPDGLTITVLGPEEKQLRELHEAWDKQLMKEHKKFGPAAYLDDSFSNLASIVALIQVEGHTLLLTGDARGDDIIRNARAAGVLGTNDRLPLDLLKLPHHGSDRNVDVDFFETFPADHYVISGDGSHGNPEVETFRMLFAARGDDAEHFTIHLTYDPASYKPYSRRRREPAKPYPVDQLREVFADQEAAGQDFDVIFPGPTDISVSIDLT